MSKKLILLTFIVGLLWVMTCDFPTYQEIRDPAKVRVWFTYSLGENSTFQNIVEETDSLKVKCTNFRLYNDTLYTQFYQNEDMFRQNRDSVKSINILSTSSDTIKIAEGLVPPYDYTRLEFQITPEDTTFVIGGKTYPLNYQGEEAETMVRINQVFSHESRKTTDIYLTYYADKGIRRIGDKFYFSTVGDDSAAIGNINIRQN